MRSRSGTKTGSTTAAILSGLLALGSAGAAFAQGSSSKAPAAAKPAAAAPAKPAAPAKAAAPAQPGAGAKPTADQQKRNEAMKIFKDAEAKFDKGDCAGALPLYRQADATSASPAPKYKIAVCVDRAGQAVEAVAAWQAFLDAKPDGDKLKDKIPEAQKRIEELKKTPAKVKVATVPEAPPNLKIMVDDVAQPGRELSLPPGKHKLAITADGYTPVSEEITVGFGETRDLSVPLVAQQPPAPIAAAEPPPALPPPAPAAGPVAPEPPPEPRSPIPAYVSFGLAGAGVVMGTVFGIMALGAKSTFEDDKTAENADAVERNSAIADISFASAVGFGAAGLVLLLSDDTPDPPKAGAAQPRKKAFVAPYVGPTGAGAAARLTF